MTAAPDVASGMPLDATLIRAVGRKTGTVLESALGLTTVEDLLRHYPRRYANRGELTDLRSLEVGEHVSVMAEVAKTVPRQMRQRKGSLLEVTITDGRGSLILTFFNQAWRERELKRGRRGLFAGQVSRFNGRLQLAHPDYILLPHDDTTAAEEVLAFTQELLPVYPASSKIATWKISKAVDVVLASLGDVPDPVPREVLEQRGLLALREALQLIHRPRTLADVRKARARLIWDEAFVLQAALAQRRAVRRAQPGTSRVARADGVLAAFDRRLPFELTDGQRAVDAEILGDLAGTSPMYRLLQGEVGSGKTVVALRAMLAVVDSGAQAALLAPTEVLAQQHHRSIRELLGPLAERGLLGGAEDGTRVALLTGSQPVAVRRRALLEAASGEAGIIIGTHALLQEKVDFFDLGLVVVDEQHRFGVEQRDALRAKATRPPHVLVMTATPIPRTVAMTVFGDLEVSTLAELPHGRSPIVTHVVPAAERPDFLARAWQRVREEVAAGHQAYVVCPRIGDDLGADDLGADDPGADGPGTGPGAGDAGSDDRRPAAAVLDLAPQLRGGALAGLVVEELHGRMPADDKDDVMRRFTRGPASADGIDVLVATTVIEVGVDVPNATMMVVLDADRFGVSQLHQLRGRVGRGSAPGLCLLVSEALPGSAARERLDAVAATVDGFELSRLDLEARREGDVLGASQSGRRSSLRLLAVIRDEELIAEARDVASSIVDADPGLVKHPALARSVAALLETERAEYLEKA